MRYSSNGVKPDQGIRTLDKKLRQHVLSDFSGHHPDRDAERRRGQNSGANKSFGLPKTPEEDAWNR
jgi:hypothetical protein